MKGLMEKNKNLITTGIIVVVVAVLSFFAGTKYQTSKTADLTTNQATLGQNARGNGLGIRNSGMMPNTDDKNGQAMQGAMLDGEITSISNGSLTLKTVDGSTIVILADSTKYQESVDVSLSDLTVGETVAVNGTTNSDGSLTAKSIIVGRELAVPPMDGTGMMPIEE